MTTRRVRGGQWPPRTDRHSAKSNDRRSRATVARSTAEVTDLTDWRELTAWAQATGHLNAQGCAAAVPPSLVGPLRRRGLVVWAAGPRPVA